jgi:uncharacterized RDD family membrane protein YckC
MTFYYPGRELLGIRQKQEGKNRRNFLVELRLASWVDRFLAWLIDFIIVSIGLAILFALIAYPFWFSLYSSNTMVEGRNVPSYNYVFSSVAFFAYWTYFEYTGGQSIGKKLLKIKSTDLTGNNIDIKSAVIESFGKAFLLPIDVILGWIFTNKRRQRIFNRLSNTIVVKLKSQETRTDDIKYTKD